MIAGHLAEFWKSVSSSSFHIAAVTLYRGDPAAPFLEGATLAATADTRQTKEGYKSEHYDGYSVVAAPRQATPLGMLLDVLLHVCVHRGELGVRYFKALGRYRHRNPLH